MVYYSIGTPIGRLGDTDEESFFRDGKLLSLNKPSFIVWCDFLHGAEIQDVISKRKQVIPHVSEIVLSLIDTEMIVSETALGEVICQRNGYGIGHEADNTACSIFNDSVKSVSYGAFLLWTFCDGKESVNEILGKIRDQYSLTYSADRLLSCIHELLHQNLIVLVN